MLVMLMTDFYYIGLLAVLILVISAEEVNRNVRLESSGYWNIRADVEEGVGLALAIALVVRWFARLWHVPKVWARISPRLQCGGRIWYEYLFTDVSHVLFFLSSRCIKKRCLVPVGGLC